MTDHDDVRTRGPRVAPGAFQDHQSWQRNDLGSHGRYAGREYYDGRRGGRPNARPVRTVVPWDAGRALRVGGLVLLSVGVAAWVWLILAFVSSIGAGTIPDHPFGDRLSGIPLGSGGLVAIVLGTLLATVGSKLARAAYDRRARTRPRLGPDRMF
jgi:hypothetical protein